MKTISVFSCYTINFYLNVPFDPFAIDMLLSHVGIPRYMDVLLTFNWGLALEVIMQLGTSLVYMWGNVGEWTCAPKWKLRPGELCLVVNIVLWFLPSMWLRATLIVMYVVYDSWYSQRYLGICWTWAFESYFLTMSKRCLCAYLCVMLYIFENAFLHHFDLKYHCD